MAPSTMHEALVTLTPSPSSPSDPTASTIKVTLQSAPIPTPPTPTSLIVRVIVSGSNPKDWKVPLWMPDINGTNSGDDVAGVVHSVGDKVTEFKVGDRVAGFHEMRTPGGSFAEYAVVEEHACFHLPAGTSFEEGATIPLAAMTAAVGLFCRLGVPEPWSKTKAQREKVNGGVVVYGAASAVGAFAVKLLVKSGVHPIICVAGKGKAFVEGLIEKEKGDVVVDYRDGDEKVVAGLKDGVVKGKKLRYAFDAVSDHGSYTNICKVLEGDESSHLTVVLPGRKYEGVPEQVNLSPTMVGSVHGDDKEFGYAWFRLFALGLKDGWFSGHPFEVMPGGLEGVEKGLNNLKDGKASAVKYVFKIADTPGLNSGDSI